MNKLTQIEIEARIANKFKDIKVLGEYEGRFTKLHVIDGLGIEYNASPDKMFEGKRPGMRTAIDKDKAFAIKATNIHGAKYSYEFVHYISDTDKVKILCPIHGIFYQLPSNHLSGQNCPKCSIEGSKERYAKNGFSRTSWIQYCNDNNKTARLYIIECYNDTERFIKIGITTRKVSARFWKTNMPYKYNILTEEINNPSEVYDKEKELHRRFKQFKYVPTLDFDGYRECFDISIKGILP